MSDLELFTAAVEHAKSVAYWRQRAIDASLREQAGQAREAFGLTGRQCLTRMRYGQTLVLDLGIVAEQRCKQAFRAAAAH